MVYLRQYGEDKEVNTAHFNIDAKPDISKTPVWLWSKSTENETSQIVKAKHK
jgi:hypothetical protein